MIRLYHTTTEQNAEKILCDQRLENSPIPFRGLKGACLASVPVGAPEEKVVGTTYLVVDLDLSHDELDQYDSGMRSEHFERYRTFHVPSSAMEGKVVITMGGDIDDVPGKLDGMTDEEREAYFLANAAWYEGDELYGEDELEEALDEQG